MSAAEWSLGARIESLKPETVQNALWHERTLLKTWAMRGTLHLLAADDLPVLMAARQAITIHRPPSYYTYHGVTRRTGSHHRAVPNVLECRTDRSEQMASVAGGRRYGAAEVLLSGWGRCSNLRLSGRYLFRTEPGTECHFRAAQPWDLSQRPEVDNLSI
jgi:hypothetical protein